MACCENTYNLGCFDSCAVVTLPILFPSDGQYTLFFNGTNNIKYKVVGVSGEPFIVDATLLNSDSTYTFYVVNNSGVRVVFDIDGVDYDCFKIKIETYFNIDATDEITPSVPCTLMCQETYDPTGVGADAFNYNNLRVKAAVDETTIQGDGSSGNPFKVIGGSGGGGSGAVDSVNGKTGVIVLDADDIAESSTNHWLTSLLKSAYDNVVTWISANGIYLVNHLSNFSNPHNVTKAQVGLSNVDNTSDVDKPVSTAQSAADAVVLSTSESYTDAAITALKDGVAPAGNTLQKLYNLVTASLIEETVANISARNALNAISGQHVFVLDDGDGQWALYKATTAGVGATYVKLSDPDLLNAVLTAAQIKASYESNPDTNSFTNALLSKLNGIAAGATANATDAQLRDRSTHTGTQLASTISNFNSSALSATASAYQPIDATLTALAGLLTGANKIPYSTGTDTFSQLDLDTDGTLNANSDIKIATQKAVKTYIDNSGIVDADFTLINTFRSLYNY